MRQNLKTIWNCPVLSWMTPALHINLKLLAAAKRHDFSRPLHLASNLKMVSHKVCVLTDLKEERAQQHFFLNLCPSFWVFYNRR